MAKDKSEGKQRSRKPRKKNGYVPRSNAIHFTIYDFGGKPIPARDVQEIEEVVTAEAVKRKYLVGIART